MRFDEFFLRGPAEEEFRIRFHEQLTVLAGVGGLERAALVDAIVDALTGAADGTTLRCSDHTGRPMEVVSRGGRVEARFLDDGTMAPAPVGWFAPDPEALRQIIVLTADDLCPPRSAEDRDDDPPELLEARRTLRDLQAQLQTARDEEQRRRDAEAEIARIDDRIRAAEGDAARREYARTLAELERVRAESAALQSGDHGAETDRHLLGSAGDAHRLAERWQELSAATMSARQAIAGDEPLDEADVAHLAEVPEDPPHDLAALVSEVVRAADHVASLEDRLREVASASLPMPEDPRVLQLATLDQDEVWGALARLTTASEAARHEQVAVGGIGAVGDRADAISELEAAHLAYDAASNLLEKRRVPVIAGAAFAAVAGLPLGASSPFVGLGACVLAGGLAVAGLVLPWRARAAAALREARSLEHVGVPTYLAFHLRRIDATIDPSSLHRLVDAQTELEFATRAWAMLAGNVDAEDAAILERTVREYADALASREGVVQEVAELRRTLDELALPDLADARRRLAPAVEPYGLATTDIDALEPALVLELVTRQVALGHVARRQRALDDAIADEEKIGRRLDDLLAQLGFGDGALEARVGAMDWAVERAREREVARAAARPREAVEADLGRLNAEVRRLRRPEWTDLAPTEVDEPDVDALGARRGALVAELAAPRPVADADHLADRHAAVERRVTAIEVQLRGEGGGDGADVEELQQYLLAALTRANHVGPRGEPIPVLLDDPLARVPAERKWELMDMLCRLAEKTQLLYLTDDPFIGAWARRRADSGTITLLEPVE